MSNLKDTLSITTEGKKVRVSGNAMAIITGLSVCAMLLIIYMFISYLEQHQRTERESLEINEAAHQRVADLRIQQCHDIQLQAIAAMARMSEAYDVQSATLAALTESMRLLDAHMREQTTQLRELRADLNDD